MSKTRKIPVELWPSRRYAKEAKRLFKQLAAYESSEGALAGIASTAARETFVCQLIESIRRVRYVAVMMKRAIGSTCADPRSKAFDPLKAAILAIRAGDLEEAAWLTFLFAHFGKNSRSGWQLARDFYAGTGPSGRWTWARASKKPEKVSEWLAEQLPKWERDGIRRGFGNHRKFESRKEIGEVVESYVAWVKAAGGHVKLFSDAASSTSDARAAFDKLYRSIRTVKQFGRTGAFDYLATIGKLGLAKLEPASAYLVNSTGPLDGAKQLFGSRRSGTLGSRAMEQELLKLGDALGVNQQVLEDAICNWQKSPSSFVAFRG